MQQVAVELLLFTKQMRVPDIDLVPCALLASVWAVQSLLKVFESLISMLALVNADRVINRNMIALLRRKTRLSPAVLYDVISAHLPPAFIAAQRQFGRGQHAAGPLQSNFLED